MSRHGFSVSYDGSLPGDDHKIDVQALAPALLAFGRLIREANAEFNGKGATAKVLVVSDFERKCFNIDFEVVLSYLEKIKSLIGLAHDAHLTAKDVLELLGLAASSPDGFATFFQFLRWRNGRELDPPRQLIDSDKTGVVEVNIKGDNNSVQVHNHIYQLSQNPKVLRSVRDTLLPVGQDGIDRVRFKEGEIVIDEIGPTDVPSIIASCNVGIDEAKEIEPEVEITPAWLSVYSPVYDLNAPSWRFRLGRSIIYADISETKIAQDALARGTAAAEDAYQVRLEITTEVDPQGNRKDPTYKVLEVLRFVPAPEKFQQTSFFDRKDD
jgi:hypothetical protein